MNHTDCKHSARAVLLDVTSVACAVLMSVSPSAQADEPKETVTLRLSGLVPRLIPDARVNVSSFAARTKGRSFVVNQFPITVRPEDIASAFLDFENGKHKRVLSVAIRPKMDNRREINISLNRPKFKTYVGSLFSSDFAIRHSVVASERVHYSTLPKWDRASDTIVAADDPTVVIRKNDADGAVVFSGKMESGGICAGFEWVVVPSIPNRIADGTPLWILITHDTGDLFGDLKDTHSFIYKKRTESRDSTPLNR